MSDQAPKRHGETTGKAHCKGKEANLKRPPAAGLQQRDILVMAKLWDQLKDQRFRGGREREKPIQVEHREI